MLENEIVHDFHIFDKVNYLFVAVNTNTGIYRIDKDRGHFHGKQYLGEDQVISALNTREKVMVTNKTKSTIITSNFDPYKKENNIETFNSVADNITNTMKDMYQKQIDAAQKAHDKNGERSSTLINAYVSQSGIGNYLSGEETIALLNPVAGVSIQLQVPIKEIITLTSKATEPVSIAIKKS
jgi:hypothetical protein